MKTVSTIGHSTHDTKSFIGPLTRHDVTAVCEVRFSPYSELPPRFNPELSGDELKPHLTANVFPGKKWGPGSNFPACYENDSA